MTRITFTTRALIASACGVVAGVLASMSGADWMAITFAVNGVVLGVLVATSTRGSAKTVAVLSTVGMAMGWAIDGYFSFKFGLPALAAGLLARCVMKLLADERREARQAARLDEITKIQVRTRRERRRYAA